MIKKRIFFLINIPFNQRDYDRYGLNIFLKNNYEVCIFDVGLITNLKNYHSYDQNEKLNIDFLEIFNKKNKLLDRLKDLNFNDVLISTFQSSISSFFIFKHLRLNNIFFGFTQLLLVPKVNYSNYFYKKINNFLIKLFKPSIIYRHLQYLLLPNIKPSFVINSSLFSITKESSSIQHQINSHQFDYDLYLESKNLNDSDEINFAVFLDEFVPFHPDTFDREPDCTAINYYADLNKFFKKIEEKFNLEVIIAGHPRSNYKKNPFDSRKIIYKKTPVLIKDSDLVLTHASTSNNFSVLYKKPIIFINSSLYSEYFQSTIKSFSYALNQYLVNISTDYLLDDTLFNIDNSRYENYKEHYIKVKGTEELKSWQIFINYLSKINEL